MLKFVNVFKILSVVGIAYVILFSDITKAEEFSVTANQSETLLEPNSSQAPNPQNSWEDLPLVQAEQTELVPQLAPELEAETDAMGQVTNVSQLRDVAPGDWAYEALQNLVERYGCIAGYPDGTYRGNRAMTRYEFAAGLNACLTQVERLIAASTEDFVTQEDLTTLQRLVDEFKTELTTLGTRIDQLEGRVAVIEDNQFSTTTQFGGELITYVSDAFGENASDVNNTNLGYRLRLDFNTSFTGKDRLRTRFQATNLRLLDTGATFGGSQGVDDNGVSVGFGQTGESRFTPSSVSQNGDLRLSQLEYRFPVGDRLMFYLIAASTDPSYQTDTIIPFIDTATGAISNFGQVNPVYFPIGNQAGFAVNIELTKTIKLDAGYLGELDSPNNPGEDSGLFNGGYSAFAQLIYDNERLKVGLLYLNSYSSNFGVDTLAGSNAAKVIQVIGPDAYSNPVVGNGYGIQANYRFSPRFELGGWVGYTHARALGEIKGDADIWNYAVTLSFPDLGKAGNLGGIVLGMQPRLTSTSNSTLAQAIGLPPGQRRDRDVGFHIEAFYRYQLTENISITPGLLWLTAPNHDERNPDAVIAVIRTSFTF